MKQHIWEDTEQKLVTTNQELFKSVIVTNAFWKNNTAKMLGHSDFREMKGVVPRKWTGQSHHPLKSAEGVIPKWKMSMQNCPRIAIAPAGDESMSSRGAAGLLRQWYLSTAPQNKFFCRGLSLTVGDLNAISYLAFAYGKGVFTLAIWHTTICIYIT